MLSGKGNYLYQYLGALRNIRRILDADVSPFLNIRNGISDDVTL